MRRSNWVRLYRVRPSRKREGEGGEGRAEEGRERIEEKGGERGEKRRGGRRERGGEERGKERRYVCKSLYKIASTVHTQHYLADPVTRSSTYAHMYLRSSSTWSHVLRTPPFRLPTWCSAVYSPTNKTVHNTCAWMHAHEHTCMYVRTYTYTEDHTRHLDMNITE